MEATTFDLVFPYNGEFVKASCQVIRPHRYYQFRITLQEETGKAMILVMYKIDSPKQTFFWFPLNQQKGHLSASIAKVLENTFLNS